MDLVADLSLVDEKTSAFVVDVNGISSADSDVEHDDEATTSDTDISEPVVSVDPEEAKREAQQAAFTNHLKKQQEQEKREPSSTSTSASATHVVKGLEAESDRIIDRVRDYQQEMFERAKAENVIAVYVNRRNDWLCLLTIGEG